MDVKIEPLQLSLFNFIKNNSHDTQPIIPLNKGAMVELSHALEKTVVQNRLSSLVFSGFQETIYWGKELNRYQKLAQVAQAVCVFSADSPETTAEVSQATPNLIKVKLAEDDALRQEWFVIVLTADFSVILSGLDRAERVAQEQDRIFDTILTFDPVVIEQTLNLLEKVIVHYSPKKLELIQKGRGCFPAVAPGPKYVSFLSALFIEQVRLYRQARRELDREQAIRATIGRLIHDSSQPVTTLIALLEMSKQLGEVVPEDLDALLEAGYQLQELLEQFRQVNRYTPNLSPARLLNNSHALPRFKN